MKKQLPFLVALFFVLAFIVFLFSIQAHAETARNPCYYTGANPNQSGTASGVGCVPDSTVNPHPVSLAGSYNNITTDTTTLVKTGSGILHTVCLNTPVATETIKLYDGLTASGTLFGTITVQSSPQPICLDYDVNFTTGLTVVTGVAAGDITISFR